MPKRKATSSSGKKKKPAKGWAAKRVPLFPWGCNDAAEGGAGDFDWFVCPGSSEVVGCARTERIFILS